MHRLNVLQKQPVCALSSYTPPAPRNTHVTLAIAHSWDHKNDSHGGHTGLIPPCFHAYIRAPFMAIYDCPYLGSRLEMVQWSRVGKGSTTASHTQHAQHQLHDSIVSTGCALSFPPRPDLETQK